MQYLNISSNKRLTDDGLIDLARAIHARGLPMLEHIRIAYLEKVTALGFSAIMGAIILCSPRLNLINIKGRYKKADGLQISIEGLLRAAGRKACLYITTCQQTTI